jgi:hypothetical protein
MVPIGQQRAVDRYRPWPVLAVYSEAGAEMQIYIRDVHQDSKTLHKFRPMAKGKRKHDQEKNSMLSVYIQIETSHSHLKDRSPQSQRIE